MVMFLMIYVFFMLYYNKFTIKYIMQIRELNLKELYTVYDVVVQHFSELSYKEFEDIIYDMRHMEYKMLGVMEGEELLCYAGVAIQTSLKHKRHLKVFEIVLDKKSETKYLQEMKSYLEDYAKMGMCNGVIYT